LYGQQRLHSLVPFTVQVPPAAAVGDEVQRAVGSPFGWVMDSSGPPATCRAGPRRAFRPPPSRSATHRSLPSQGKFGLSQVIQAS
jgi:hypothetical protein